MIREAGPEEREAVEALLLRRIEGAMFPLSNLRAHGLGRGDFAADHHRASRFWRVGETGLIGLSRRGLIMPLLEGAPDPVGLRAALAGLPVTGAIGPAGSVRAALAALEVSAAPTQLNRDEPGFALDLARLRMPDVGSAVLKQVTAAMQPMLVAWRAAYNREALGTPEDEAAVQAAIDVAAFIAEDSHRVLMVDGQPVALTGFNARLPEIVQIGGVYTPPALRGRGHARLAVALHLAEARDAGVRRAVLFAASEAAARAYLGIGFQPALEFALVLLTNPVTVTP